MTLNSYFALFSITKLITGLAYGASAPRMLKLLTPRSAMQLVQQGKLTLDEPIEKVLYVFPLSAAFLRAQ